MSTYVDRIPRAPADWGEDSIREYLDDQEENRQAEQRADALAKANRHRFTVARERRKIAALSMVGGSTALARIVEGETDPAILSGRVIHYLRAIRYRESAHVERIARRAGIHDRGARLRDLSKNERAALAAELRRRS